MSPVRDRVFRLCERLLEWAARETPPGRRGEWLEEWEGELWILEKRGKSGWALLRFAAAGIVDARREGGGGMMRNVVDEIRAVSRGLVRAPGFAAITVVVLALGIGANTAVFSVFRAALLDSGRVQSPGDLSMVDLTIVPPDGSEPNPLPFSWPAYEAFREGVGGALTLAGFVDRKMNLLDAGDPVRIGVEVVTPEYFTVVGVPPALGRVFSAAERVPNDAPVALLSHRLWQERFGGDGSAVGRTVRLNGVRVEIVGVLPERFQGLTGAAEAWVPMALAPAVMDPRRLERPRSYWFDVAARPAGGASREVVEQIVSAAGRAVDEVVPNGGATMGARAVPFVEARVNPTGRLSILVVSGAALLLLLVACVNVGGLMVARSIARRSEAAVRAVLGAGRGRLVRTRLIESVMLATVGGVAGVGLALIGVPVLARALPHAVGVSGSNSLSFISTESVSVNWGVLLFAVAVSLTTGLLAGLGPSWIDSRKRGHEVASGWNRAGRRSTGSRAGGGFVVTQLAFTVVLLVGAGLMTRSLMKLNAVELGVGARDALLAQYELPREWGGDEVALFHGRMLEELLGVPGVESASISQCSALSGMCDVVLGNPLPAPSDSERQPLQVVYVDESYFGTMEIPIIEGRAFQESDGPGAEPAVILSEGAAETLFPDGDALGKRISASIGPLASDGEGGRVIGLVPNVQYDSSPDAEPFSTIYVSYRQMPVGYMTVAMRGTSHQALVGGLRRVFRELAPEVPLYDIRTLGEQIAAGSGRTRVIVALLSVFAVIALLMASTAVFGLMAFAVSRRTREIGVRIALGASPRVTLARVLLGAAGLATLAGAIGIAVSRAASGALGALLFQIETTDLSVAVGSAAIIVMVTLLAAYIPARRAAGVDPAVALQAE